METYVHFCLIFAKFFLDLNTLQTKAAEKLKIYFMFNNVFFSLENRAVSMA
jgi:hypothetical protein